MSRYSQRPNSSRRDFLRKSSLCLAGSAMSPLLKRMPSPYLANNEVAKKVIVLGMDGLDPKLVKRFVAEGHLPTFAQLIKSGQFGDMQTTMPPQSPVAWSSFISGTNPGGHGIFDFIHRDPKSFSPYLSTARSVDSSRSLSVGKWKVPLGSGKMESMRGGPTFFGVLEKHNVDSTLFKIPANFPVTTTSTKAVSGMGTPDLLGGYGISTLFTENAVPGSEKFSGTRVVRVYPQNHTISTSLNGPKNTFREDSPASAIDFKIFRDPQEAVVKISIQDQNIILKQGEFSEWIPLSFPLMPVVASIPGMVRFYLKSVHPQLSIYCSPINVDPLDPALPISSPPSYSRDLANDLGRYYTQGFPADTKALTNGIFSDEEYFKQARIVLEEDLKAFEYQFERFKEGFFFFYFSCTDQNSHMLWRLMDPQHPLYKANADAELKNGMLYFYKRMDEVLAKTLTKVDSRTLLIAMSDHGFAPFTREFNLSTWLVENGFTTLRANNPKDEGEFFDKVDWSKTKAYALGINGIYLNLKGRENHGSLEPSQAEAVKAEIIAKLPLARDPLNNNQVVLAAYDSAKIYSGPYVPLAPDILVGYQGGYRISDHAVLGKFPSQVVTDRIDPWAADHCLDPLVVPGMLLCNRNWNKEKPGLWDMGPTILEAFGLDAPIEMTGRGIFRA